MRTFIADDNAEVRSALGLLVRRKLGFAVVGEAAHAGGLADGLRAAGAELLLVEWELPGGVDPGLLAGLRKLLPRLRIVALTADVQAAPAIRVAGADAVIYKGDPAGRTLAAIRGAVSSSSPAA